MAAKRYTPDDYVAFAEKLLHDPGDLDAIACIEALRQGADAERRAARAEALVTQWRKDVADYPSATDHDAYVASVSVSMCADELAKALADPKTEPTS